MALLFLSWIFVLPFQTEAGDGERYGEKNSFPTTLIGFSLGSYRFHGDRIKKIYGNSSVSKGLEFNPLFSLHTSHYLTFSLEVKNLSQKGASTLSRKTTQLTLFPVTLAGKYLIRIHDWIPYVGAGWDYYHYEEASEIHNTSGSTIGYHVQGGAYYQIPSLPSLFMKIFVKFTKATTQENSLEVDLGGLEAGLGLIWGFHLF